MKRNVFLLAACQALMMTGLSLVGTTSALVGYLIAEDKALATVPHALQFIGMMSVTFPASLLMGRIGRRAGFLVGAAVAIVGASISAFAVYHGYFAVFCVGSYLVGCSNAFGQYYRFAAADVSTEAFRSRAISLVLSGGVVAAFAGPNLARFTQEAIPGALFAGCYVAVVALYVVMAGVVSLVQVPHAPPPPEAGSGRGLAVIARQPTYLTALACAVVAYGVMSLLMIATPLAMQANGLDFAATTQVIQFHILGMYAPAFFTGHLIRRFGVLEVMQAGTVLLALSATVNLAGVTYVHFWSALLLLGLGWNFMFTGATTLVTETYDTTEKAKAQGFNDLVLFSFVSLSALASGALHHAFGWTIINLAVIPAVLAAAFLLVALRHRRARAAARVAAAD